MADLIIDDRYIDIPELAYPGTKPTEGLERINWDDPFTRGLNGYYLLRDQAVDLVHGEPSLAPTGYTFKDGRLKVAANSDYIATRNHNLTAYDEFVVFGRFRADASGVQKVLWSSSQRGTAETIRIERLSYSTLLRCTFKASSSATSITSTSAVTGAMVSFVWQRKNGNLELYINGKSDATPVARTGTWPVDTPLDGVLGNDRINLTVFDFSGEIDDIGFIRGRALEQDEITKLYRDQFFFLKGPDQATFLTAGGAPVASTLTAGTMSLMGVGI